MDIISTHDTENGGTIRVVHVDGEMSVPDNMSNRHRRMVAEWEAIEGNERQSYVAPQAPPATETLINRVQFKSMLALLGKSVDDVMSAIDAVITDPTQNTIAKVKVTDSDRYARDNELFTILAPSLNLTDAAIDAAWEQAVLI
jgi:hypothetical protein